MPGDRFTESEVAERFGVSRTPVRDALYRLRREGYLDVAFRSGWSVRPFDFSRFDELYDLRILIECAAVERIFRSGTSPDLSALERVWLVDETARACDPRELTQLDEEFHTAIVAMAGNREMAEVHTQVTEKIRVVRRLDFFKRNRVEATYAEHGQILQLLGRRKEPESLMLLRAHVIHSKEEVRKITLHMLYEARNAVATAEKLAS